MSYDLRQVLQLLRKPVTAVKPLEWLHLHDFFQGLVPLWFCPEAVRHVQEEIAHSFPRPQLPQDRGSCWIVMAVPDAEQYPLLKPAFVIPLQWQRKAESDKRLPAKLRGLAEQVRTELAIAFGQGSYQDWNLYLHRQFTSSDNAPDFSGLDDQLRFDSGWFALAGGLYLALNEGQPDEHVWISARWDREKGIQRVGHLAQKLQLAAEHDVRLFYIPDEQDNEVPRQYQHMVRKLRQGTTSLRDVLDVYLSSLDVRPACPCRDEASFRRCADWYMRQPLEHFEYYCEHLLPYIAQQLRVSLRQTYPYCNPDVLVSVASPSWNLVPLVARILEVRRCVILHTENMTALLDKIIPVLKSYDGSMHFTPMLFREATEAEDFSRLSVWQEYPPDRIAVDVTPGKKRMTLDLYRATPRGSWVLYVDSVIENRRPRPGTEKLEVWYRQ